MNRFLPDTWRDALLRPLAMAAPDAGAYVEIMAPDFRFALILMLGVLAFALAWRKRWHLTPTLALAGLVALSFVPWLATTGNGRYFIPVLIAAGPLCIALIHGLPFTRSLRATAAIAVLTLQVYAVYSSNPWHSWGWVLWNDKPFFTVELDREALEVPSTYVTLSSISYSLIAPRFPASSRWTNIAGQPADPGGSSWTRLQQFLGEAKKLKLLVPTMPDMMTKDGLPNAEAFRALEVTLSQYQLAVSKPPHCRLLRSPAIAEIALRNMQHPDSDLASRFGFWVCDLDYPVRTATVEKTELPEPVKNVFAKLENTCPRFFHPGGTATQRLPDGVLRMYSNSDIKAYVLDNGDVLYKYYRALNPVRLGTIRWVLGEQFTMDCNQIQGRSGLPWERSI